MSCSKDNVTLQMISKGFIKPNYQVVGGYIGAKLSSYLDNLQKIAKERYSIEEPLFRTVIDKGIDSIYETPSDKIFLKPNIIAFEAIDNSKQAQIDKLYSEIEAEIKVKKDWQKRQEEGLFEEKDGEIVVPDLPRIKNKCK